MIITLPISQAGLGWQACPGTNVYVYTYVHMYMSALQQHPFPSLREQSFAHKNGKSSALHRGQCVFLIRTLIIFILEFLADLTSKFMKIIFYLISLYIICTIRFERLGKLKQLKNYQRFYELPKFIKANMTNFSEFMCNVE